jgi:hypothetical protein
LLELEEALNEFKKNYVQFAQKNRQYVLMEDELTNIFSSDATSGDIKDTAKIFEDNIWKTVRITERRKSLTETKWTARIGQFLTKLYPVARLSCGLTAAIAEVLSQQLDNFSHSGRLLRTFKRSG